MHNSRDRCGPGSLPGTFSRWPSIAEYERGREGRPECVDSAQNNYLELFLSFQPIRCQYLFWDRYYSHNSAAIAAYFCP
jgi:hypothetical protein